MIPYSKSFVINHAFENIINIPNGTYMKSPGDDYFGLQWQVVIGRSNEHLELFFGSPTLLDKENRETAIKIEAVLISEGKPLLSQHGSTVLGNMNHGEKADFTGWSKFANWNHVIGEYLMNNMLHVKVYVEIESMTGIYKSVLRHFGEAMRELSDIVLTVQGKKFFVSKLYLATHSDTFKTMLLGCYEESNKKDVTLNGIDADDFQNYLEVLYGDDAIDDNNVDGILLVADMFHTPLVLKKCEKFLINESRKTRRRKVQLSIRFNLNDLQNHCVWGMRTDEDLREMLPKGISILAPDERHTILTILNNELFGGPID